MAHNDAREVERQYYEFRQRMAKKRASQPTPAAPAKPAKKPAAPPNPTNQLLWVILGIGILLLAGMITLLALLPKVQG